MSKITATDAENIAREFIGNRHPRIKTIRFTRTLREGDVWLLEGKVWFKWAYLFTVKKPFRLRISAETMEVASYEETKEAK